jgi:hypothetical protein
MTDSLRDTILAIITNNTKTYEHPSEYIDLLEIRNHLTELDDINPTRSEVDAALLDLHLSGDAHLMIEEGFRFLALHPEYVEAGVRVGGEIRHLISLSR